MAGRLGTVQGPEQSSSPLLSLHYTEGVCESPQLRGSQSLVHQSIQMFSYSEEAHPELTELWKTTYLSVLPQFLGRFSIGWCFGILSLCALKVHILDVNGKESTCTVMLKRGNVERITWPRRELILIGAQLAIGFISGERAYKCLQPCLERKFRTLEGDG